MSVDISMSENAEVVRVRVRTYVHVIVALPISSLSRATNIRSRVVGYACHSSIQVQNNVLSRNRVQLRQDWDGFKRILVQKSQHLAPARM